MNKKAAKTLKAAAKNYKEKVRQPVVIEFQEEHLNVIIRALEVYQRLRLGQVDYALSEAFDHCIDYEDRRACHKFIRDTLFKDPDLGGHLDASWGIYNQEKVGDATLGYEVQKTLRRYKAFKRNDGWADYTRDFDAPHSHTGVPLPVVQGAIEYKDFKIPKRLWKKINDAVYYQLAGGDEPDWKKVWEAVDKAMPNLPRGERSEIIEVGEGWIVRVTAAHKPKELEEK